MRITSGISRAVVASAAANVPVATLRATSGGYLAAWIEDQRGTRAIRALSLDPAGKPAGAPILVLTLGLVGTRARRRRTSKQVTP